MLATTAVVHASGPNGFVVAQCPECTGLVKYGAFWTIDIYGEPHWSDCKSPGLVWVRNLVACPHCSRLFWCEDAKQVGEIRFSANCEKDSKAFRGARETQSPAEDGLYALLCGKQKDREREMRVRLLALQATNDRWRNDTTAPAVSERARQNMMALADMLDEKDQSNRLLKAEIARELGDFAGAKRLLEAEFDAENSKKAAFLRKLAKARNKKVAKFPDR